MPIPESQLDTWSHQGSVTQSSATYESIRAALLKDGTDYAAQRPEVFLQGSYSNDTNIYAESDVDCVILYNGEFYHDLTSLPPEQKAAFMASMPEGTYSYETFKTQVGEALEGSFGSFVDLNSHRAIKIKAGNGRRSADVIVAFQYRRYYKFNGINDQNFDAGILFFSSDGKRIANYPKIHSANLTFKHKATGWTFKPVVRIFKNLRSKLMENRQIEVGSAPSYFIEGLLYNVPDNLFKGNYTEMLVSILNWLHQTSDRTNFICANRQYYLFRADSAVSWSTADGTSFINEAITLWNNW
jgi:hypothetical protein